MSGLLWPIFWMLIMLGLVVATVVVAMRERKARNEAIKKMKPQPMPGVEAPLEGEEGFGEPDMIEFGAPTDESFAKR